LDFGGVARVQSPFLAVQGRCNGSHAALLSCTWMLFHPPVSIPFYRSSFARLVAESPCGEISEVIFRFDEWKKILSEYGNCVRIRPGRFESA